MRANSKKLLIIVCLGLVVSTSAFATTTVWSWVQDMYNQPSIKPQEEGSMKNFPIGSVTTNGIEIMTDGERHKKQTDFSWISSRNNPALAPKNPQKNTKDSVERGEYLYTAYCGVCHGADGEAKTTVALFRGGVLPLSAVLQDKTITDGYLYYKITYGGIADVSMPPFGYAISEQDRWHIVNYLNFQWRNQ
jgi:mono/diheme cytochrome c family protein